ncbi:MAG: sulfatase-like hydrolase/transferase [Deltaproteobacteria bacterium]|nr:sulfatase-like hydrolase/transferase [Deltaproteobacteria bacterium]
MRDSSRLRSIETLFLILLCSLLPSCDASRPADDRPNLILIVGDDHGHPDFGFLGSEHALTPNLDRLAREGSTFRNGYVTASICGPSLRTLLTGLHPAQWTTRIAQLGRRGIRRESGTLMQDFTTLPRLLAERGYASFQGGKLAERDYGYAGFSDGVSPPGGPRELGAGWREIGRETMEPIFDFIDAHSEEPFFLWFAPLLPHRPFDAPPEFEEPFRGKGYSEAAVRYYANILRFDQRVGELLEHLERKGLRERSLIVYLSDNGWEQDPFQPMQGRIVGLGGPKGKKSMYDLGFRTPILLSWPGHVPAGGVHEELVSSVDLFPTFLDYAGAASRPERPGTSLRAFLEKRADWTRDAVIGRMNFLRWDSRAAKSDDHDGVVRQPASFVRTREWHYIWHETRGEDELYDMTRDPAQERDVAAEHPELVTDFRARIEAWRSEMRRAMLESPVELPANPVD